MAVAAILIAAAGLVAPGELVAIGYGIAFGWAPLVGLVEAYRLRHDDLWGAAAAALLDAVGLVTVTLLAPELAPVAVWMPFVLVALYGQVDLRIGLGFTVVGIGVAVLAQREVPLPGPSLAPVALYGAVLLGVLWLQRGWDATQAETSSALSLAHGRAETVLAHIADAVVVTGPGGRVRRMNPAAERTLGCPADAAIGARCHEVFELRRGASPLDCSAGCALLADTGDDGVEVSRELSTGVQQPLLATARVVTGRDGQAMEVVHSFQDITELTRAQEAQSLFLATATHELKTPLTLILGFAEMLETQPQLTAEQRDLAAQTIHRRATELDRIVEQLLLSSRIGAGRVHLDVTTGSVAEPVVERVEAVRAVVGRPLTVDVPRQLPPAAFEPDALATVLDHLLENALKYSPGGEPVAVTVTTTTSTVDVCVQDHGIGMTPEQRQRCFDRFWQAENSSVRRFSGTGLGLYIVRSLVTAMGGSLSVTSRPGQGTTFRVHLPRADIAEATTTPAPVGVGERTSVDEFMRQVGLREAPS